MTDDIDLIADLNAEDDDGLGWSTLADARKPDRIVPGVMILAGNSSAQAVVRIVAVDDDGQVHFSIRPGSVAGPRSGRDEHQTADSQEARDRSETMKEEDDPVAQAIHRAKRRRDETWASGSVPAGSLRRSEVILLRHQAKVVQAFLAGLGQLLALLPDNTLAPDAESVTVAQTAVTKHLNQHTGRGVTFTVEEAERLGHFMQALHDLLMELDPNRVMEILEPLKAAVGASDRLDALRFGGDVGIPLLASDAGAAADALYSRAARARQALTPPHGDV